MTHLPQEAREAIVSQAINRGTTTLEAIAKSNNIGQSTLERWVKNYQNGQLLCNRDKGAATTELSYKEQFEHILATTKLDDVSLGKYCRKHGLYSHQIIKWREYFMRQKQEPNNNKQRQELKKLKDENKRLQAELRRKDKALAEASALLILKKKADLIWGVDEGD